MAIGDGGNDLPLLQSVGLGVAMGNAVPQVCLLCYCTTSANVWSLANTCFDALHLNSKLRAR